MSDSLRPHGLQHTRLPCPSLLPSVCSNSCPLSWWCYPTICSVTPFSSCAVLSRFQSCLTLCNTTNCSPPGSPIHGLLQARIWGWIAVTFSRGSSQPRLNLGLLHLLHWQAGSLPLAPLGNSQSSPTSWFFPMSQLFASGGQGIGVSASVLPMNTQGWFPLGVIGLISLLSKGFSRVLYNGSLFLIVLEAGNQISVYQHECILLQTAIFSLCAYMAEGQRSSLRSLLYRH